MRDAGRVAALRARLIARLRQVIGDPAVEAKELAAFELLMSRREFLRATQYTAIAGFIAAGTPPTLWGRRDPTWRIDPKEVGVTPGDQASATAATQLTVGTELFEETIYAQPAVAPDVVGTHAVIEGARGRLKVQSDLDAADPTELQFLDTGYHYGPTELIQAEETSAGWELVHYHHPWGPRTDGATTDGLVRDVLLPAGEFGLQQPIKVLATKGSCSNRYTTDDELAAAGVTYLVVVIDQADIDSDQAPGPGRFCVGAGNWRASPTGEQTYAVEWKAYYLADIIDPYGQDYIDAAVVSNAGYTDPSSYRPELATEHIVLYMKDVVEIFTLADLDTPGYANLIQYDLPYPDANTDWRVVHIDWDPTEPNGDDNLLTNVVMARNVIDSNGQQTLSTAAIGWEAVSIDFTTSLLLPYMRRVAATYDQAGWTTNEVAVGSTQAVALPDLSAIQDVNGLYAVNVDRRYHVKTARLGTQLFLYVVAGAAGAPPTAPSQTFTIVGMFPLAVPDVGGVGQLLAYSGGVSKFDGFRFVASDDDANAFILRQRRATATDTPYAPPIYGQNDATGAPRTSYSSTAQDPLPTTTAATSNLHDLATWVANTSQEQSGPAVVGFNLLLNAALAFATDDTSVSQATCLGSEIQAVYASNRFADDSGHVQVTRAQGSSTEFGAYLARVDPVTKSWHLRQIASQIEPDSTLKESGDHYQAIVAGANAYGRPVQLGSGDNANLRIEVRADVPTMVTDDTHNRYYDIDRYTSFIAAPDPSTGRLAIVVKAETFAQVLYVRLVDTSGLQPSGGDAAMFSSAGVTTYPWQTVNIAAQAQQRMANDGSSTIVDLLGDESPTRDTTRYISGGSLTTSANGDPNTGSPPWQFKANYAPTQGNTDDLGNLATYLNTSGQNLIAATPQLGLGAAEDGQTIDPLTAVTAVSAATLVASASGTTTFTYPAGTIGYDQSTSGADGPPGSIWSGISHALHDALHWLQHVADDTYKDLAEGAVSAVLTADSITATVSKDIMKAVNGVDESLTQVVSTVEEYANILVNLVVTIVEQSFLYKLVELIIAIISLFVHLKDIQDLSRSLYGTFDGLSPLVTTASWAAFGSDYIGTDNALTNADAVNNGASSVPDQLVTGLIDAVSGNPLTKKILDKIMSFVLQYADDVLPDPPIGFAMPASLAQAFVDDIEELEAIVVDDVVTVARDAMNDLMTALIEDIEDPQATYGNLTDTLHDLADEIDRDVQQVFDWVDGVLADVISDAQTAIGTQPYVTMHIAALADLCTLFGIGSTSDGTLKLEARDAVFFPMAVVIWVAVYMLDGTSIKSVGELTSPPSPPGQPTPPGQPAPPGQLAATASPWTIARLAVDLAMTELSADVWSFSKFVASDDDSSALPVLGAAGAWLGLIRWINDLVYTVENATPNTADATYLAARVYFAIVSAVLTVPGAGRNPGEGWPDDPRRTDIVNLINAVLNIAIMGYDTYEVATDSPGPDQVVAIIGQDLTRTQIVATTIYDIFFADDPPSNATVGWAAYVTIIPAAGWVLQELAANGTFGDAGLEGQASSVNR